MPPLCFGMQNCPHSRDRRQPPCGIVNCHAPAQFGIEARDLVGQPGDLVQQEAREVAHSCRQHAVIAIDDGRKVLLHDSGGKGFTL
jgi:hypothetical protein